jgi:very-short-patch-repair endonuclease
MPKIGFRHKPESIEKMRQAMLGRKHSIETKRKMSETHKLVPHHLAFEADGEYWHDSEKDAVRDKELFERFTLPVVRFKEKELWAIYGQFEDTVSRQITLRALEAQITTGRTP